MTLDDVENKLRNCTIPKDFFGDDVAAVLKQVRIVCHPDRFPGDTKQRNRAEEIFKRVNKLAEDLAKPAVQIKSPKRVYDLVSELGIGDVADVHLATCNGNQYAVKVSRVPEGAGLLDVEQKAISRCFTQAGKTHYSRFIPTLAESFPVKDKFQKRVNVFVHEPGYFTAEEIRAKYPRGLDGKHLAWIYKRILTAIGFVHRCGYVHGAIVPCHINIHAVDHGIKLLGWGHSVKIGEKITSGPGKYMAWYPHEVKNKHAAGTSTDIFLAAQCMVYLAGGDPTKEGDMPTMPKPIARFVKSCLLEGPKMRPQDAWGLLEEFDDILRHLYGPPKYHKLVMP